MKKFPREVGSSTICKYASTAKKMCMTVAEAVDLSHEIAGRLKEVSPHAELVVGIARGALLLTSVVANDLGLPMAMITVRKGGNAVKDRMRKIPGLLYWASKWYQNEKINAPLGWMIRALDRTAPIISEEIYGRFPEEVILLDDAEETGQTFMAARDLLSKNGARKITFAVIMWSTLADTLGRGAHAPPDVYIGRSLQHFPWSGNSPYYDEYLQWLAEHHVKSRSPSQ